MTVALAVVTALPAPRLTDRRATLPPLLTAVALAVSAALATPRAAVAPHVAATAPRAPRAVTVTPIGVHCVHDGARQDMNKICSGERVQL